MTIPASHVLAGFSVGLRCPEKARHFARRALLDTVAVAVAGGGEEASRLVLDYARTQSGEGRATVWATGERLSPEMAALVNGTMGHVLDYDDVSSPLRGHPSVVLLPTLTALAEAEGASACDVLDAFVIGLEVVARLGRAAAMEQTRRGWHTTANLGVIAAAAACARLLRLPEAAFASAIGLALAQAAGTRENFGTMAKSFQAGQAAASALRAVQLARLGLTATHTALEGPAGLLMLYGLGEGIEVMLSGLGEGALEVERTGLDIKRYPCCYATHRAIEAALDLRREHRLTLGEVREVEVLASRQMLAALIHPQPRDGISARFSMPYAMAAALEDGAVTLSSFTDAAVLRPNIQTFLPQVRSDDDKASPVLPRWTIVRIVCNDGRVLERRVEALKGSAQAPLSDAELTEKAAQCLASAGHPTDPGKLAHALLSLDEEAFGPAFRSALGYADALRGGLR